MSTQDIANDDRFLEGNGNDESPIIKVIGVGGGGNNATSHMFNQNVKHVTFAIVNTDRQALLNSPVPTRLMIGPTVTKGLGAGNKPEVARAAAEESEEDIKALFNDDTRMVFITAGMGGGTGTGAAPVVARIAKELGVLTIGIVTIPFLFEGERKILKALAGAEEMQKNVDALLVINNERLTEIYPDLNFDNGFAMADDTLTVAARSIAELITTAGRINVDFNDVDTTLRNGGAAVISTGYGEGPNRVTKAIDDALNSPLLKNRDILSSKRLLFNLYYSREAQDAFVMAEAAELTNFISTIDSQVDVIWGVKYDETLENKVKITILAAGFEESAETFRREQQQQKLEQQQQQTVRREPRPQQPEPHHDSEAAKRIIAQQYGTDKVEHLQRQKERQTHIILNPAQMDDDATIETLENTPAYNRDKKLTSEINNSIRPDLYTHTGERHATDSGSPIGGAGSIDFLSND